GRDEVLSIEVGFYLATMGGARVCDLEDRVGGFAVGKEFDALLVDIGADGVMAPVEEEDGVRVMLGKFLMTGDDRNIVQVFVRGRIVKDILDRGCCWSVHSIEISLVTWMYMIPPDQHTCLI